MRNLVVVIGTIVTLLTLLCWHFEVPTQWWMAVYTALWMLVSTTDY